MGASASTEMELNFPILSGTEDRAVGCLVGLAVGDAFGVTQEIFPYGTLEQTLAMVKQQRATIQQQEMQTCIQGGGPWAPMLVLKAGEWTDDTAMALCLADSLLTCGRVDQHHLMSTFVRWWDHGYNACRYTKGPQGQPEGLSLGLGATVKCALRKFADSEQQAAVVSGLDPDKHAGNGCIMRLAPVAVYYQEQMREAISAARLQSETTHNLPECLDASALLAYLLVRAIQGTRRDALLDPTHALGSRPLSRCSSAKTAASASHSRSSSFGTATSSSPTCTPPKGTPIHASGGGLFSDPDELILSHEGVAELASPEASWRYKSEEEIITLPGRALWTLEAALWVVNRTNNFREAIMLAASLGGDADTVCAVVGQLAGALYGESGIPLQWRAKLHHYPKIRERGLRLVRQEAFSEDLILP